MKVLLAIILTSIFLLSGCVFLAEPVPKARFGFLNQAEYSVVVQKDNGVLIFVNPGELQPVFFREDPSHFVFRVGEKTETYVVDYFNWPRGTFVTVIYKNYNEVYLGFQKGKDEKFVSVRRLNRKGEEKKGVTH